MWCVTGRNTMARWRIKPGYLVIEHTGYDDFDHYVDIHGNAEGEYIGPSMLNPKLHWVSWTDAKGKTRYVVGLKSWFEEVIDL